MNLKATLLNASSKGTLAIHNNNLIEHEKRNLAKFIQRSQIGDFVTVNNQSYEIVSVDDKGQPVLRPYVVAEVDEE